MSQEHTHWLVGKLAYCPDDTEWPWKVTHYGTVAEQGGPRFGAETLHYKTLEDACRWLEALTKKDLPLIEERIAYVRSTKTEPSSDQGRGEP